MSLPSGFLDELRSRVSLAQVVGRRVVWDSRKSQQGKGDMWAPCPFHQEKTASFHVDDRKGFYYCFGCHAKGDAIAFLREAENMGFMEAVETLAGEAGMTMPARDPAQAARDEKRAGLSEIVEMAVGFFRLQLKTQAGAPARDYLDGRGLDEAARDRWEIGYAPEGWQNLRDWLSARGVEDARMIEAGLVKASSRGGAPYDVFRDRIMFPIRDARGRAIAFGGRAMSAGESAKYLNSPETPIFDKGRVLFNAAGARAAAGKDGPLVLAEGYMDVIALAEAGFAAVAPLGTAVTEDQLRLLWRMADEPVVALDGDAAGLRAAMRVIDLALPLIEAGRGLRFALMPQGQDPDDLIRAGGRAAMSRVLDEAVPMVRLLWRRETEGRSFDSPERKAALDRRLRDVVAQVADPAVRRHYDDELRDLRFRLFRGNRGETRRPAWKPRGAPEGPTAAARASALAAKGAPADEMRREAAILAILAAHPALVDAFLPELERLETSRASHEAVRRALLALPATPEDVVASAGREHLDSLLSDPHLRIAPGVTPGAPDEIARMALAEEFAKLSAIRGARREIAEAVEEAAGAADEGLTWRLGQAAAALEGARRANDADRRAFDRGPNGVLLDRAERQRLEELLRGLDPGRQGDRGGA